MTEKQLIAAFEETTQLHANEAAHRGLHPIHIANVLMVAAVKIVVQAKGIKTAKAGLQRVMDNLGADHG